jgi:hypothetical protein
MKKRFVLVVSFGIVVALSPVGRAQSAREEQSLPRVDQAWRYEGTYAAGTDRSILSSTKPGFTAAYQGAAEITALNHYIILRILMPIPDHTRQVVTTVPHLYLYGKELFGFAESELAADANSKKPYQPERINLLRTPAPSIEASLSSCPLMLNPLVRPEINLWLAGGDPWRLFGLTPETEKLADGYRLTYRFEPSSEATPGVTLGAPYEGRLTLSPTGTPLKLEARMARASSLTIWTTHTERVKGKDWPTEFKVAFENYPPAKMAPEVEYRFTFRRSKPVSDRKSLELSAKTQVVDWRLLGDNFTMSTFPPKQNPREYSWNGGLVTLAELAKKPEAQLERSGAAQAEVEAITNRPNAGTSFPWVMGGTAVVCLGSGAAYRLRLRKQRS